MNSIKEYNGDIHTIKTLLEIGGDKEFEWYQDTDERTPLHHAADHGHLDICKLLIEAGHPWNCLDKYGKTPAEYAKTMEIYEFLLNEAVRSEMILNCVEASKDCMEQDDDSMDYLNHNVAYSDGLLVSDGGDAVMMKWEAPLMLKHAKLICGLGIDEDIGPVYQSLIEIIDRKMLGSMPNYQSNSSLNEPFCVLNVGFGMGIIDTYIHQILTYRAKREPGRRFIHFIIEAHPGVLGRMKSRNWQTSSETQPELVVLEGKWQEAILWLYENQVQFDGIFFDTFGESYKDLKEFHEHVGNLLRSSQDSVYSYFNGLGGRNPFFNHVYSQLVECELHDMGLMTEWGSIKVQVPESDWESIKHKYFTLESYRLPVCKWQQ